MPTMISELSRSLNSVLLGKEDSVSLVVAALLADGHVLVEDVPGTGKTTLARALSKAVAADYARIQFTPDLMPADVTGGFIYKPGIGDFELKKGPVFTQILLADEINRASPRTQSALLEAMEERSVSLEGKTYTLSAFFMVLATENPVEFRGVFPLPEAQMDRFLIRLSLGYPSAETELEIIRGHRLGAPVEKLSPVTTPKEILNARAEVREVHIDEALELYMVQLVQATRGRGDLRLGASPRSGMALASVSRAFAYMDGRDFVTPDDILRAVKPVLEHRIFPEDAAPGAAGKILDEICQSVRIPR